MFATHEEALSHAAPTTFTNWPACCYIPDEEQSPPIVYNLDAEDSPTSLRGAHGATEKIGEKMESRAVSS